MAQIKISALTAVTSLVDADVFPVDSGGAIPVTTKISWTSIKAMLAALYQPLTSELTTLGALTSTTLGRNMLQKAHNSSVLTFPRIETTGAVTLRTAANMVSDIFAQPLSTNLTQLATATPSTIGFSFIQMDNLSAAAYIKGTAGIEQGLIGMTPAQTAAELKPLIVAPGFKSTTFLNPLTVNIDAVQFVALTAVSGIFTVSAPTGTPYSGQRLTFRFKDAANTARAITWNGVYKVTGVALATGTLGDILHTIYLEFIYNEVGATWDLLNATDVTV